MAEYLFTVVYGTQLMLKGIFLKFGLRRFGICNGRVFFLSKKRGRNWTPKYTIAKMAD